MRYEWPDCWHNISRRSVLNTHMDTLSYKEAPESHTTLDAQYSYRFEGSTFGNDTQSTVRIGARNLTDEIAPPIAGVAGYDERIHDPRGRYIYVSLTTTFN